MDPNLRTLSLSAWMSLPGLDFTTWQLSHPIKSATDEPSTKIVHEQISAPPRANGRTTTAAKKSKTTCRKCEDLQTKSKTIDQSMAINRTSASIVLNNNNNNESEYGAVCCKCSKLSVTTPKTKPMSQLLPSIDERHNKMYSNRVTELLRNEKMPSRNNGSLVDDHLRQPTILPRRNLTINRQVSKEVQTRALVSRVAEYYESYVAEMDLAKNFVSDITVTAILPLQQRDLRFKNARWVVYG